MVKKQRRKEKTARSIEDKYVRRYLLARGVNVKRVEKPRMVYVRTLPGVRNIRGIGDISNVAVYGNVCPAYVLNIDRHKFYGSVDNDALRDELHGCIEDEKNSEMLDRIMGWTPVAIPDYPANYEKPAELASRISDKLKQWTVTVEKG